MRGNSTRTYWMENKDWYEVDKNGKPVLTPLAPPEARRSFAEWHTEPKMTWYRFRLSLLLYFYEIKYMFIDLMHKEKVPKKR